MKYTIRYKLTRCKVVGGYGHVVYLIIIRPYNISYCVKITHVCNKPVQAAKEMAGGGLLIQSAAYGWRRRRLRGLAL